jgi:hypothetical protein
MLSPLAAAIPSQSSAQPALRPGTAVVIAPVYQSWRFGDGVLLDSLRVRGATQISAPFAVTVPVGGRWAASATGAVATSRVDVAAPSETSTRTQTLTGISDLRVRMTGRILGDALQLTLGVNLPTGKVGLTAEQHDVLRVIAAPALDAQVPVAGLGLGGTVGLIYARTIGTWAWAGGAGVEQRGRYTPLESRLAGLDARTELVPGRAVHMSVGTDGLLGAHRLSAGVVVDIYSADEVRLVASGAAPRSQEYQLGPTVSALFQLQVANPIVRDLTLRLGERYRSTFRGDNGADVAGSSGNYIDLSATGFLGAAGSRSLLLGVDVRQHTGLTVDPAFIGAGLSSVGATFGVSLPSGSIEWRPSLRAFAGSLRTGHGRTGMTGFSIGVTAHAR